MLMWLRTHLWTALPPLPAPARDVRVTPKSIGLPLSQIWKAGERANSLWKGGAIVANVEPSLPSQHQLEMCLRRPKASACHLARSGKGGEGCFILPLSHVRTWGRGYFQFGNGNQFP